MIVTEEKYLVVRFSTYKNSTMKGYVIVFIILVGIIAVYGWNNARKND